MIPLKDDNPTRRFPTVTVALIGINVLVHLYQMSLGPRQGQLFIFQYGLIPAEITGFSELTPQIPFPIWLSPFTSMFIHADLIHLGGNMLYLWIFGNNIEDFLGPVKFTVFYFLSGLAAVGLFVAIDPHGKMPLIGASGAISGVLGAYMLLYPYARILTLIWIIFFIRLLWLPAILLLGYWIFLQLIMGVSSIGRETGGVAWFAHIGGFAFGWILFRLRYGGRKRPPKYWQNHTDYYNRWH